MAQMLNYGKPVMGLPLCQTELDEGLGHLDKPLDRIQKIEASHWVCERIVIFTRLLINLNDMQSYICLIPKRLKLLIIGWGRL